MARSVFVLGALLSMVSAAWAAAGPRPVAADKLDAALRRRAIASGQLTRVIVRTSDVASVETLVGALGGRAGRRLTGIGALVAEVPDRALAELARAPSVESISMDRRLHGTLERTGLTIGARWVAENLGVDGSGVGVAIIDSGVTRVHDDLGGNRVAQFVDFVDFQPQPHDGYGHGTHVAGIIAGSGYDSGGARRGIAPGAHLIVLRALDQFGDGFISNAIAAIDYAIEQRAAYNVRVINLSVAAGVYESYNTDPLTLAARRAVDAGILVVTAAGNHGRNDKGQSQLGGITSPGNAPWVLTVGASSHNGTPDRRDDSVAPFSSLGPGRIDLAQKPDVVAPGVGMESLADPGSTLFAGRPAARIWGSIMTDSPPYLSLSGTSMAAPVVSATAALMLQANPALTPGAVKRIIQATAEPHAGYGALAQGAGFLDARAAVELSRDLVGQSEAMVALDAADAGYDSTGPADAPACEGSTGCPALTEPCAIDAGCVDHAPAGLTGLAASPQDTVIWAAPAERSTRRRVRATGRKHRPRES
jgi:serine protease AprX